MYKVGGINSSWKTLHPRVSFAFIGKNGSINNWSNSILEIIFYVRNLEIKTLFYPSERYVQEVQESSCQNDCECWSQRTWEMKLWRIWTTHDDSENTWKKKTAPTQKTPSSLSYIEIDGQQITDPLSTASAFYYNFTKIQLSANSAASADDDLQADMNFLTWAFGFFQNSNRWFYAIQCSSHDYQTSWREHKAYRGNKATGLDGFGIKIIKLALLAISLKAQLTLYNTSIQSMTPSFRQP